MRNSALKRRIAAPTAPAWLLVALCATACLSGGCRWWRPQGSPQPVIFSTAPTLEQAMGAVNENTNRIRQLKVGNGRLSVNGLPSLTTTIALERPRRFRMRGETSITGAEIDLGSNEELFWIWAKRNEPAAVLFARHDRFQQSAARQFMPFEPQWLLDAMGLVEFDTRFRHDGPFGRGPGKVEVRAYVPSPEGDMLKIVVLNDRFGYVEEAYMYDARGTPLAAARLSGQRYYAQQNVSLPTRAELNLPLAGMSLRLDMPDHLINQETYDAGMLYQMPQIEGYPLVDITDPNFRPPMPAAAPVPVRTGPAVPVNTPRPAPATYPQLGFHPQYRGYEARR